MLWLLANWQTILGVIATAALAYLLHTVDVDRIEAAQRQAIAAQIATDTTACEKAQAITKGVSDDLQKKLTDLAGAYDAIKRVRPNACIALRSAKPSNGRDAATGPGITPRTNAGLNSDDLYGFARDAESYRLQLIACQSFISQTWASQGQ